MADPLSIASGIAGLVTLADVVFNRAYHYAKVVKSAEKEIKELVATIQLLSGLLHSLAIVLAELEKDNTIEFNVRLHHINSCRNTLSEIQRKLDDNDLTIRDGRIEGALRKLKWPFSQPETKQFLVEIEQHIATINVAHSADSLNATLRALSRQEDLKEQVQKIGEDEDTLGDGDSYHSRQGETKGAGILREV